MHLSQLSKFVDYTLQAMKLPNIQDPTTSEVKLKSVLVPVCANEDADTHSAMEVFNSSQLSVEADSTTDVSQTPGGNLK